MAADEQSAAVGALDHELKTWPREFAAILTGDKRHEWRRDDRGFSVGDRLYLREYEPGSLMPRREGHYTGRHLVVEVTWITRGQFQIPDGFVVMSFRVLAPESIRGLEGGDDEP